MASVMPRFETASGNSWSDFRSNAAFWLDN
jgi:hypothetical protein